MTDDLAGAHPLVIEPGSFRRLAEVCRQVGPQRRWALVADSYVARLYLERAASLFGEVDLQAATYTFPAGEWNKTREQWARLTDLLVTDGFGRDSALVALGGGVTGDLVGFVAATFMRGVPVVQVPTTLLAMLDSSVGGKTGLDTPHGKNLVGAFHAPSAVLIDPELLATLPRFHRAAGAAEAIKTAAILDATLWDWALERADAILDGDVEANTELIERVVRHKQRVVEADPREGDQRAILNFGHTVGHAIESASGFALLHGQAVAAGIWIEARMGERLGVTEPGTSDRIAEVLTAFELDEWGAELRADEVWEAMLVDKKGRGGVPRCVLIRDIGETAHDPDGAWTFALGVEERGAFEDAFPVAPGIRD